MKTNHFSIVLAGASLGFFLMVYVNAPTPGSSSGRVNALLEKDSRAASMPSEKTPRAPRPIRAESPQPVHVEPTENGGNRPRVPKITTYSVVSAEEAREKDQKTRIIEQAESHLSKNQWTPALELFQLALNTDPRDAQIYERRGRLYHSLKQFDKALVDFNYLIEMQPDVAGHWENRGMVYYGMKRYPHAVADFDKAITLNSQKELTYTYRGLAYIALGNEVQGQKDFAQAEILERNRREGRENNKNQSAQGDRKTDELTARGNGPLVAGGDANRLRWRDAQVNPVPFSGRGPEPIAGETAGKPSEGKVPGPLNAQGYKIRGQQYRSLNQLTHAIEDFTKAIQLDPTDADAFDQRGQAHLMRKDFAVALLDFGAALQLDPKNAAHHAQRGLALFQAKRFRESLADFAMASVIDPSDSAHPNHKGTVLLLMNNPSDAALEFSKVLAINPKDSQALNSRASAYRLQNRLDEAIADYTKAIEIAPCIAVFRINRGNAYFILEKHHDAIIDFNRAIEIDPSIAEAYAGRAATYRKLGMDKIANTDSEKSNLMRSASAAK